MSHFTEGGGECRGWRMLHFRTMVANVASEKTFFLLTEISVRSLIFCDSDEMFDKHECYPNDDVFVFYNQPQGMNRKSLYRLSSLNRRV